jgi:hypothetical protein
MTSLPMATCSTSTRASSITFPDFPYTSLSYGRSYANIIDVNFSRDNSHFGPNVYPQPGISAIERFIVPLSTARSFSVFVFAQSVRRREQTPIAGYAIGLRKSRQW